MAEVLAEVLEDLGDPGAGVLEQVAADVELEALVGHRHAAAAEMRRLVEDEHLLAVLREQRARRQPGGSSSDHNDVDLRHRQPPPRVWPSSTKRLIGVTILPVRRRVCQARFSTVRLIGSGRAREGFSDVERRPDRRHRADQARHADERRHREHAAPDRPPRRRPPASARVTWAPIDSAGAPSATSAPIRVSSIVRSSSPLSRSSSSRSLAERVDRLRREPAEAVGDGDRGRLHRRSAEAISAAEPLRRLPVPPDARADRRAGDLRHPLQRRLLLRVLPPRPARLLRAPAAPELERDGRLRGRRSSRPSSATSASRGRCGRARTTSPSGRSGSTIVEPMNAQRLRLDDPELGLAFDVSLRASAPAFFETRHQQVRHGRLFNDVLRYTQVGPGRGRADRRRRARAGRRLVRLPRPLVGDPLDDGPARADRRPRGGVAPTRARCGSGCRSSAATWSASSTATRRTTGACSTARAASTVPGGRRSRIDAVRHALRYEEGTRRLAGGDLTLVDETGAEHEYRFEVACAPAHPQGFGYTRGWSDGGQPGVYRGIEVIERDRFDVSDPAARRRRAAPAAGAPPRRHRVRLHDRRPGRRRGDGARRAHALPGPAAAATREEAARHDRIRPAPRAAAGPGARPGAVHDCGTRPASARCSASSPTAQPTGPTRTGSSSTAATGSRSAAPGSRPAAPGTPSTAICRPGAHVGLLMRNQPEFLVAFYGALVRGGIAVPLNAESRGPLLHAVIEHSDVQAIVVRDELVERLTSLPDLGHVRLVVVAATARHRTRSTAPASSASPTGSRGRRRTTRGRSRRTTGTRRSCTRPAPPPGRRAPSTRTSTSTSTRRSAATARSERRTTSSRRRCRSTMRRRST